MEGIMVSAATGVMNSLLDTLTRLLGEKYKLHKGVKHDIVILNDELSCMKALLEKLAGKEVLDPQQKEWRNQVREMSYDIEDCIDKFMHQLQHEPDRPSGVMGFFRYWIERVKKLGDCPEIVEQIRELKVRLTEASHRRKRYRLDVEVNTNGTKVVPFYHRLPALYTEASKLVGIDGPMEEVIKLLNDGKKQVKVVSIVGYGGLGKTALANQVYQKIGQQFDCRAFVSLSQNPDMRNVLGAILSQIKNQEFPKVGLGVEEWLIIKDLRDSLKDKRYLIVIDDIWSTEAWDTIMCGLTDCTRGSRIISTTRIIGIAKFCCSPFPELMHELMPLSEEDSKSLFFSTTFGSEGGCPPHLEGISIDIIRKCGGLPLAIITMATLLITKPEAREEWISVQKSIGLGLEKRILSASYNDLPCYLKTCLLYLSMYPKDYEIQMCDLVRRWIAEGFLKIEDGRSLHEVGICYFNELINRSLIQPIDLQCDGQATAARVHNVIHDLILFEAIEENFVTLIGDQSNMSPSHNKIRRLLLNYRGQENVRTLPSMVSAHVRSLGIFGYSVEMPPISDFHALRVLYIQSNQLENYDLRNIGKLILLRYLWIDATNVTNLPEQIGELQYLETLDIYRTKIRELSPNIIKLQRLKWLHCRQLKLPEGLGSLQALEELSEVIVYNRNSLNSLMELGSLTSLRTLRIDCYITDSQASILASSLSKLIRSNLQYLQVWWGSDSCDLPLDSWSPPSHLLRELSIAPCYLQGIPEWIASLANLTLLRLKVNQVTQEMLQILGNLPALLCLYVESKVGDPKERLIVRSDTFKCLKILYLWHCNMGLMFEAGAMPKLEEFSFDIRAREVQSAGSDPCLGIYYLSALRILHVDINCDGTRVEEVEILEAAIRVVASRHPNRPSTNLIRSNIS